MRDVYIISAVRSAIGKRGGVFKDTHPVHLVAPILCEAAERAGIAPAQIEDVILGCVTPLGDQGGNIARLALLHAGFPIEVPGVQLNRMCGSGQQAAHFAAQAIAAGDMEIVLAGGIEHMTRVPIGADWPKEGIPDWPYQWVNQGISAEMVADRWGFTRDDLDDYSFESHRRAAEATKQGYFEREIFPLTVTVDGESQTAQIDEGIRFDADRAKMSTLKPVFKEGGKVTAANASQISDGASALILASEDAVKRHNLKPRARFVSRVVLADDPVIMLTAPIPATRKAATKAGLTLDQIDIFEVNEAFASVPLAWAKELGVGLDRVNVNGGAIANGHPLGASGAKLMTTMLHELERRGARYGLQTMCIGHGQATATIIERLS